MTETPWPHVQAVADTLIERATLTHDKIGATMPDTALTDAARAPAEKRRPAAAKPLTNPQLLP